jgi:hypothetical protein
MAYIKTMITASLLLTGVAYGQKADSLGTNIIGKWDLSSSINNTRKDCCDNYNTYSMLFDRNHNYTSYIVYSSDKLSLIYNGK